MSFQHDSSVTGRSNVGGFGTHYGGAYLLADQQLRFENLQQTVFDLQNRPQKFSMSAMQPLLHGRRVCVTQGTTLGQKSHQPTARRFPEVHHSHPAAQPMLARAACEHDTEVDHRDEGAAVVKQACHPRWWQCDLLKRQDGQYFDHTCGADGMALPCHRQHQQQRLRSRAFGLHFSPPA
jgi:hypothetical protein